MKFKDAPIRRKLMGVMLLTCAFVLFVTCTAFVAYEYVSFRHTIERELSTLGAIVATNSTAALAFNNRQDATEMLNALRAEKHIVAACLYDQHGALFATYPPSVRPDGFPARPETDGFRFGQSFIHGFLPVAETDRRLGTLYLQSDMTAMYARFERYALIALLVVVASFLLTYLLSRQLQRAISQPILDLATVARVVSQQSDYSVRATRAGNDEIGVLTDAFNHMLTRIEVQNTKITAFNHQLERKVLERTHELERAKSELESVNDQLVKSNRDLEQFAYVASHDLQEPLRKIQIFSELAARDLHTEPPVAREHLDKINASARRMADLIIAVLNYSRLTRLDQQFTEVDLNSILEDIKNDLEVMIWEKNAEIRHTALPVIKGVPLQLNQLFLNLIGNALKFADKQPRIRIESHVVSREELALQANVNATEACYAEIVIEDNGIGFEQQYAEQIFTIFQRLHTKQHYNGTGIGLALCKKIVENHHGVITVRSEVGKGTRFAVYLPIES